MVTGTALLRLPLLIAGLSLACTTRTHEPIYRYINVLDGGTALRLGEPFPQRGLADRIDDTTWALKPGTFGGGGTKQIWAYVDTGGVLRRLEFYYDGSETYSTKLRDYSKSLGQPTLPASLRSGAQGAVWTDSLTRFALYLDPQRPNPMWSELADLSGRH